MGKKRKFSSLEFTLIVLVLIMTAVAITLVALFATGQCGYKDDSTVIPPFVPQCPDTNINLRIDCIPDQVASEVCFCKSV
ncbi:hypothetical protein GDO86_010119 [Hymenochirus boettgeri]|uniref:Uncharacterized protein n=1 Tax=Hymenochirus boettgeri TaxID=247094 RepID=A0A8T2JS21_9PIPI|nr:hypothetical protein GDO86_010119 [Hymenochirus boettgeri]